MAAPTPNYTQILLNSGFPPDIRANCSQKIIATALSRPPVTFCNWRVNIARDCSLICVQHHYEYQGILIAGAVFAGLMMLLCGIHLIYRRYALKRTLVVNREVQPVEGLLVCMVFFTAGRMIHNILTLTDTFNTLTDDQGRAPMLLQGDISFEVAFPLGFAGIIVYTGGLVRMLLKVKTKGTFYRFIRNPLILDVIIGLYVAYIIILQIGLAAFNGTLNQWITRSATAISWAGLDTYLDGTIIRYTVWATNCLILIIITTIVMFLFVSAAEEAATRSKSNTKSLTEAIHKMKLSVVLIDVVLAAFIILNILAMTQRYWGKENEYATLWICALWNFVPLFLLLLGNIVFAYRSTKPSQARLSTVDSDTSSQNTSQSQSMSRSMSSIRGPDMEMGVKR